MTVPEWQLPTKDCTYLCALKYWLTDGGMPCPHGVQHTDPTPWNCGPCNEMMERTTAANWRRVQ
jgi:hypothetical protein